MFFNTKSFVSYRQQDAMDCGPTCLRMIAKHYGQSISQEKLKELTNISREGVSLLNIADAAEKIGFRTLGVQISYQTLEQEVPLPCILHWNKNHLIVVYKIKGGKVYISDPGLGLVQYDKEEFIKQWMGKNAHEYSEEGVALILEPSPNFNDITEEEQSNNFGFLLLYKYLLQYKRFIYQLILGLFAGSILQFILPFLTQAVVDIGIQNQDLSFIYLILVGQLFLYFGQTAVEFIRGWISLHLVTRINISLISDFFIKLLNLPIAYFDTKMTGDIMQRISDHHRIESLLTTSTLNTLFSLLNLVVFGIILAWFSLEIFLIFSFGSIFYICWIILFLKKRERLDIRRFSKMGKEKSKVIELVNGMQEIKLHGAERQKLWAWQYIRASLFKIEMQTLSLEQTQTIGSSFINDIKNIFMTILAAKLVIDGEITLGIMMSISFIIGQLNGPIEQLIGFIFSLQDAKISLDRLSEIHNQSNEEVPFEGISDLMKNEDLHLKNLKFQYPGSDQYVINDINLLIPANKTTAIVGSSGSGKTTLMKILLKFYSPVEGELLFGNFNLQNVSHGAWRKFCGVVMQEGYIFNDSIANNIALGDNTVDIPKLLKAVEIACIKNFIESLPLGYNTKIGSEGVGISSGQKQRLLIARAIYKDPNIIFFDEATSALDSNTEQSIVNNLDVFFADRTAVVIAHRLSTVRNADQIVVLEEGKIIEQGSHDALVRNKGAYYKLVRNQLDLEA